MSQPILIIKNLQKSFDLGGGETLPVLTGVDIKMEKTDFFALMGASGSGKSTLLNIVGGLVSSTSGSVRVCDKELSDLNDSKLTDIRRHDVGWIFQNFALVENLTAVENVIVPLNLAGQTGPEVQERAKELLQQVGIIDRMNHFPDGLSGGQQQRVAIARALANDPPLILADEPTGNLDTKTGEEIIQLFKKLAENGKTILMVTHDVALAHAADKVFILKNGATYEETEEDII